jgi:hypothetical protein
MKTETQHIIYLGHSKSSTKGEVHSNQCPHQKKVERSQTNMAS